jgi:preprotein translocase subunit SecG
MFIFATLVHVLLSVFMILVILLQPGKDAGMGAAFGGGAATSAFGGRGAVTFLSKLTAVCAGLFFLTSLGLSFVGLGTSVADRLPVRSAPAAAPTTIEQPAGEVPPPGEPVTPDQAPEGSQNMVPHAVPPAQPAQEIPPAP